jgi:predicted phosphoribosyltransferase
MESHSPEKRHHYSDTLLEATIRANEHKIKAAIPRTALDSAIAVAERLRAELAAARIEPLPSPVTVRRR